MRWIVFQVLKTTERQAQDELRRLTVGELRADWLAPEMILRLAAGDPEVECDLEELTAQPDAHRPFDYPYFWGAFICQGVPAPLASFRTDSRHL